MMVMIVKFNVSITIMMNVRYAKKWDDSDDSEESDDGDDSEVEPTVSMMIMMNTWSEREICKEV